MLFEIKLKYYNSALQIGLNDWKKVYDCKSSVWLEAKEHKGRLVYGNNRIPYHRIKSGLDQRNKIIQQQLPF